MWGREENQGFRVTRDMVLPMLCRGFKTTVVCDKFFCTLKLSHYLAAFGCQLLGTTRVNIKEMFAEAKDVKNRSSDTTISSRRTRANLFPTTTRRKSWCCCLPPATTRMMLSQWRPPSIVGQATSCPQAPAHH
ncbi:hypothetical protein EIN_048610 [Entamoeba invadens IP1]|uniref:PiggyBac transposable element-derived protein domain-containing protein n=1 Tax=Entamoeba invadens IP1 TaxID=370355 RepID=L7FN49_ENTIV|nr:hypothetical protein EIN_048610 [Entamoeba invadens IP1]ELP92563.1 hypothetical protein EIN_048610 [Entamoeba invadens IP1]|eukprot:XP_004259334.1 hypothetical protein EIN_048610 [Entamoeba invadens IP1]